MTTTTSKNPEFERCLMELSSSENKKEKQEEFEKCLESLRLFPLALESPSHCRILEGFTKKIVKLMESKLSDPPSLVQPDLSPIPNRMSWDDPVELPECFSSQNSPVPLSPKSSPEVIELEKERNSETPLSSNDEDVSEVFALTSKRTRIKKIPEKRKSSAKDDVHDLVLSQNEDHEKDDRGVTSLAQSDCHGKGGTHTESQDSTVNHTQRKRNIDHSGNEDSGRVKKSKKEYVPKAKSGAYAVLMTLYKNSLSNSYKGFMTKPEIIEEAQPLSQERFTISSAANPRYTAWSGVSILSKKDLIRSWSNPKKFDITLAGKDLARRISLVEKNGCLEVPLATSEVSQSAPTAVPVSSEANEMFEDGSWLDKLNEFSYCYVEDRLRPEIETENQECAEMDIEDGVYYLIKCLKIDLQMSSTKYKIKEELNDGIVLAFLHECDAKEKSPLRSIKDLNSNSKSAQVIDIPSKKSGESKRKKKPVELAVSDVLEDDEEIPSIGNVGPVKKYDYRFWLKSGTPNENTDMIMSALVKDESIVSEFYLRPGGYEIVLLVDTAETQGGKPGGKSSRREITSEELIANGVKFERRNMNVGDFLWIAKENIQINDTSFRQRPPRELVLPYVVERKRMDDLKKSIIDRRYAEQKFRLKNCGIGNVFYLVEESAYVEKRFDGNFRGFGAGSSGLEQAIANTAVQERFFIQRTKDQKQSVEFLTTMSRALIEAYRDRTLQSCVKEDIDEDRIKNPLTTLMNYKEFNEFSRKNKDCTVKEVFMKMLLQQRGLTPTMALSITNKYETPRMLMNAYKNKSEKDMKTLLQEIKYDNGKKIPISISRTLGILFSSDNLL